MHGSDREAAPINPPSDPRAEPGFGPSRRVFIQRQVLLASAESDAEVHPSPDAALAVDAFRECGWHVTVIGAPPPALPVADEPEWCEEIVERVPGAWLLTDDVGDDRWARPLGLRTALVRPAGPWSTGPERCDVRFRDLRTAALEILATEEQPAALTG